MKNATNGRASAKGKSQRISYGDGLIRLDRPGALAKLQPHDVKRSGRFEPEDRLLAFLDAL